MKKIPMVTLLVLSYLLVGLAVVYGITDTVLDIWLVFFLLVELPNMIYAFLLPRWGGREADLLFWNMVLKLCQLPIFLAVLLLVAVLNLLVLPLLPMLFVFAYTLLLSTSAYGISALQWAYRRGALSWEKRSFLILLHCMFFSDVVCAVSCWRQSRREASAPDEQTP